MEPVILDVLRVDAIQLSRIDQLSQCFTARYFVHLRIQNGAKNPHLVADIDEDNPRFPRDTLKPGAAWYLNQIDFPTAVKYTLSRAKVVQINDHLDMVFQVSGTFHSNMALHNFPVDVQCLSFLFTITCAKEGIVPVDFQLSPGLVASVVADNFGLSNLWKLHDRVLVEPETNQPMPETTYPALRVSTLVIRRPVYFYINVIVPMASLTLLAHLQFMLPGEREGTNVTFRITYTVTILLTTATYKLFIASALPIGLAYMTLLDKYVLFCYFLQVALVCETAINGAYAITADQAARDADDWSPFSLPQWSTSKLDFVLACVSVLIFIGGHVWFFARLRLAWSSALNEQLARFDRRLHSRRDTKTETFSTYRKITQTENQSKPSGPLALVATAIRRRSIGSPIARSGVRRGSWQGSRGTPRGRAKETAVDVEKPSPPATEADAMKA